MANGKIPTMVILCGKCGIIGRAHQVNIESTWRARRRAEAHAKECAKLTEGETVDIYKWDSSAFK